MSSFTSFLDLLLANWIEVAFGITFAVLVVYILRERKLFRIAARYVVRHKGRNFLSVLGIAIGVSMIGATMIISDSFNHSFRVEADENLGRVDLIVSNQAGTYSMDDFRAIRDDLLASEFMNRIEGIAPRMILPTTAKDNRTSAITKIQVVGFNDTYDEIFGDFTPVDGSDASVNVSDLLPPDDLTGWDPYRCIITEKVAGNLRAQVGDGLILTDIQSPDVTHEVKIVGIAQEKSGKVAGMYADGVFMLHNVSQELFFTHPFAGVLNLTTITVISTKDYQNDSAPIYAYLQEFLRDEFGTDHEFEVVQAKIDAYDEIVGHSAIIILMLTMFSMLIIIGGVLLIVNTQAMGAEERVTEIGMLRAIGAYQEHVRLLFIFEGIILSLVGSLVGIGFGISVSKLLIEGLPIFGRESGSTQLIILPGSLIDSFCAGFLITMAMVILPAISISRVKVVTAVRGYMSEVTAKQMGNRLMIFGGALLGISGVMLASFPLEGSSTSVMIWITFGNVAILGAGLLISRLNWRTTITVTGGAIIAYSTFSLFRIVMLAPTIPGFFIGIIFLILAMIIIIGVNIDNIAAFFMGILHPMSRKARPITRISSRYLTRKRLRTTLTFSVFSFILCMTVVLQVVTSSFTADPELQANRTSGGIDLVGRFYVPTNDFINQRIEDFNSSIRLAIGLTSKTTDLEFGENSREFNIYGVDPDFFNLVNLHFLSGERNATRDEIRANWTTAVASPDITELAAEQVTNAFTMQVQNGTKLDCEIIAEVNYIPGLASFFSNMMLMDRDALEEYFPSDAGPGDVDTVLIDVDFGEDMPYSKFVDRLDFLARELETEFEVYGLTLSTVHAEILDSQADLTENTFFFLLFMNIGLLIGVFGIMISNFRGVSEREQVIGVMRAIGYQRKDIALSVVLETLLVTSFGVIVGYISGLTFMLATYGAIFNKFGFPLVIPHNQLAIYIIAILGLSVLSAYIPARRAAKTHPAEALRTFD